MNTNSQTLYVIDPILDQELFIEYGHYDGAPAAAVFVDESDAPVMVGQEDFTMGLEGLTVIRTEPEVAPIGGDVGTSSITVGTWCGTEVVILIGEDVQGNLVKMAFRSCCWATAAYKLGAHHAALTIN